MQLIRKDNSRNSCALHLATHVQEGYIHAMSNPECA